MIVDKQNISTCKVIVDSEPGEITVIKEYCDNPIAQVLLAHGAGAGIYHPFMEELSSELARRSLVVTRFNFPYMEAGKKLPGSDKPTLEAFDKLLAHVGKESEDLPLFIAGKSYGGRMASHYCRLNKPKVAGLIYYGFPLHAAGKPDHKKATHLKELHYPMLFLQGKNDKLARLSELLYVIENLKSVSLEVYEHADHSFKRPKKITEESLIPELAGKTKAWIQHIMKG